MKKIKLSLVCIMMFLCMLQISTNNNQISAAPGGGRVPYNEEEGLVIGKKQNHSVGEMDYYGTELLSKKLVLKENTVLKLDINTTEFNLAIGKRLDYGMGVGRHVFDDIYTDLQNYEDSVATSYSNLYYLPKGTYYISMQYFGDKDTITYKLTKNDPDNYLLNCVKYKYNMNGGNAISTKTIKWVKNGAKPSGAAINVSPKRTGYEFSGFTKKRNDGKWLYRDENYNLKWYASGEQPSNFKKYLHYDSELEFVCSENKNATVTNYVYWDANKFTIQYHANGGKGSMSSTNAVFGKDNVAKKNTFSKSGYAFKGWYVKRDSDGKWLYTNGKTKKWFVAGKQSKGYAKVVYKNGASFSKTTSVNGDVLHLYAKWVKK